MQYTELISESEVQYPNIVIKQDFKAEKHKLSALRRLMNPKKGRLFDYRVYLQKGNEEFEIGGIYFEVFESLLEIVGNNNLIVNLSESEAIQGTLIYALLP